VESSNAVKANPGLRHRFSRGIGWNLVGTVFLQGSVFLGNLVIARLLGAEMFGVYAMVVSTLLTVTGLAQFSTGITATRYIAQSRETDKDKTARILVFLLRLSVAFGLSGMILLMLSSDWLANHVLGRSNIGDYLVVSAGYVLFSVTSGFLTGALAGLEGYRSIALVSPIQAILHIFLCGMGAWGWGAYGAAIAVTLSSLSRCILLGWALLREADSQDIPWRGTKGSNEDELLTRFSIPATMAGMSSMPALWLSNAFLVQQVGGYKEMGLYGAAFSLRTLIVIFTVIVNNVTSAFLNFQLGIGNVGQYRKLFSANLGISLMIAVTGTILMAISGREILGLFGAEFEAAYPVLLVLMLAVLPETLQYAVYQVIQSRGLMWLSLYGVALPRDAALLATAYYLTRDHGALGLAIAYAAAWIVAFILTVGIVWKRGLIRQPYHLR
jgi:O-antigen/teichoic acid export membrane protein